MHAPPDPTPTASSHLIIGAGVINEELPVPVLARLPHHLVPRGWWIIVDVCAATGTHYLLANSRLPSWSVARRDRRHLLLPGTVTHYALVTRMGWTVGRRTIMDNF